MGWSDRGWFDCRGDRNSVREYGGVSPTFSERNERTKLPIKREIERKNLINPIDVRHGFIVGMIP